MIRLVQSLIFIAILNISGNCYGQSNYIIAGDSVSMDITTLEPPFVFYAVYDQLFYFIDIDNDNIDDFELRFSDSGGPTYYETFTLIKGLGTYEVAFDTNTISMVKGVMQGDTINNSLTFLPGFLTIITKAAWPDEEAWNVIMDGGPYIPIIRNDGGVQTFGWIKIEIPDDYIIIYSYAIEITTSLLEYENSSFNMHPNPTNNFITITANETVRAKKVRVYSITGQIISEKAMPEHILHLELSELQSGIYLLEVETEDGFRGVKQLIIEH